MRGNVAIEFGLLLLVALIFIVGADQRLYNEVVRTVNTVSRVRILKESMLAIRDASEIILASSEGSMLPLTFTVPADANILLSGSSIIGEINVGEDVGPNCSNGVCTISVSIPGSFADTYSWSGPASISIIIENNNGRVSVK